MKSMFSIAKECLLEASELTEVQLQQVLEKMLTHHIDSADLYFQSSQSEYWMLENGIVKEANYNIHRGVGVRAISGEKMSLAYSDEIALSDISRAAQAASSLARSGGQGRVKVAEEVACSELYLPFNPLKTLSEKEKVSLLRQIDQVARLEDSRVLDVIASLSGVYEVVLIVATDGTFAADVRPLIRLNVNVIVEEKGRREQGFHGAGGRTGYDFFLSDDRLSQYAKEAVRQAIVNLEAVPAPAGLMPVILGPGWPGVLLHEAIGHGLEGDFNRKGSSAFSGRVGEKVASPLCTIVDDGTLAGLRGSLNIDDEGVPSQYSVLIENGILKGYMQDKLNARLMGETSTGNGRRESYAHLPLPRMTNTYMLAGSHSAEEMIRSVEKGLYAVNFAGGQVDITSGKFVFSASEAYLIEKGKVTHPVKGATLIGNGPDVLMQVSMVGDDLGLDDGVGTCGKEGQSVPVGVGQPTLKIDELTVGGTQA